MSNNKVSIEQWHKLVPGVENIKDLKQLHARSSSVPAKLKHNGDARAYEIADIPAQDDPRWRLWEPKNKEKTYYEFSDTSRLAGKPPLEFVDFTYIQSFVDIPENWEAKTFDVSFDQVDDGARIYVFNSDHPFNAHGPQPDGSFDPKNDLRIHGSQKTGDIKGLLKKGEVNRLVIVQFDDQAHMNTFKGLKVEIDGASVTPTAPKKKGLLAVVSMSNPYFERSGRDAHAEIRLHDMPSIEIIFDSSGSMGQEGNKMSYEGEQRTRDYVAKQIYKDLLKATIPRDALIALRIFGPPNLKGKTITTEYGGKSLHTTLYHELNRWDRQRLAEEIDQFHPNGNTPITESLEQVERDLGRAPGSRLIVLLTDGFWNGKPSPLAAVRRLQESDTDFKFILNIVGVGLDAKHRKEFEEVAKAAGGRFFRVDDEGNFLHAMRSAVGFEFEVLDQNDKVVGNGSLDGPGIELEPGEYHIVIKDSHRTEPRAHFQVEAGQATFVAVHRR